MQFNPNAAVESFKKMVDEFGKIVPGFDSSKMSAQIWELKEKKVFTVNGKKAEVGVTFQNSILIVVENQAPEDVTEILMRLLKND